MSPVSRLLGYVRRYPRKFILGIASVIVSRAFYLLAPGVLGWAIDGLTKAVTAGKLIEYGSLLLAIGVVGGIFRFLTRRLLTGVSRDIEYDMRNEFFAHLQTLP